MRYIRWFAAALGGALLLGFLGLLVKPSQFAAPTTPDSTEPVRLVSIPAGLPAPVDRWYRAEFPQGLPVYDTVVMRGTGTMRIAGIALPFRHLVELRPGRGFYRKMDITWFDIAFLHGLDTFVDGTGVMNTPVGRVDGAKIDQGANVVNWLELLAVPGVLAETPGVRWEPIDQTSARLVVPFAGRRGQHRRRVRPAHGRAHDRAHEPLPWCRLGREDRLGRDDVGSPATSRRDGTACRRRWTRSGTTTRSRGRRSSTRPRGRTPRHPASTRRRSTAA